MSKVIQVLEQIGSSACLQSKQAIEQLLTSAVVDAEQAQAIINKDVTALERQLDVRLNMVCGVFPAEDDDGDGDGETDDKDSS